MDLASEVSGSRDWSCVGFATGVLLLPRSSLLRGPRGGWQVFAVRDGRAVLQDIQVGLMNDSVVEIASGLGESDLVILAPDPDLRDGIRVRSE